MFWLFGVWKKPKPRPARPVNTAIGHAGWPCSGKKAYSAHRARPPPKHALPAAHSQALGRRWARRADSGAASITASGQGVISRPAVTALWPSSCWM
jgi:hypothetical protein